MPLKFSSAASPENTNRYSNNAPDVFSRGSLMFTYELLRKNNPELALTVRNIVHGTPLDKSDQNIDCQNTDHFQVQLSPLQIRAIVEGLVAQDIPSPSPENMGKVIMAKALVDEWAKLARKMLQELPEEQSSSF
ncbi:hypothetical protein [Kiloniella majae]|uniref:hypothetical protein n=1 Tax=Kiloniella majae TaxID=1938558 RepID=UPI000A278879|nr:hypothetical protein [Kiloniella majae]